MTELTLFGKIIVIACTLIYFGAVAWGIGTFFHIGTCKKYWQAFFSVKYTPFSQLLVFWFSIAYFGILGGLIFENQDMLMFSVLFELCIVVISTLIIGCFLLPNVFKYFGKIHENIGKRKGL